MVSHTLRTGVVLSTVCPRVLLTTGEIIRGGTSSGFPLRCSLRNLLTGCLVLLLWWRRHHSDLIFGFVLEKHVLVFIIVHQKVLVVFIHKFCDRWVVLLIEDLVHSFLDFLVVLCRGIDGFLFQLLAVFL